MRDICPPEELEEDEAFFELLIETIQDEKVELMIIVNEVLIDSFDKKRRRL